MIVVTFACGTAEAEAVVGPTIDLEGWRRVGAMEGTTDLVPNAGDKLGDYIVESNILTDAFNPARIDAAYGSRPIELVRRTLLEIYIQNVGCFGVFV